MVRAAAANPCRRAARRRAAAPNACRRSGSSKSAATAAPKAAASPSPTSTPVVPSATMSGTPPTLPATTGRRRRLSLEERHAVGLVDRRPDEKVARRVKLRQGRRPIARQANGRARQGRPRVGLHRAQRRAVAGDKQPPRPLSQALQGFAEKPVGRRAYRPGASSPRKAARVERSRWPSAPTPPGEGCRGAWRRRRKGRCRETAAGERASPGRRAAARRSPHPPR